jgi:hypothetical protein
MREVRNDSTTPFWVDSRWVMVQLVLEDWNRLTNCRNGVRNGLLKSTITNTESFGPPASSVGSAVGVPDQG